MTPKSSITRSTLLAGTSCRPGCNGQVQLKHPYFASAKAAEPKAFSKLVALFFPSEKIMAL